MTLSIIYPNIKLHSLGFANKVIYWWSYLFGREFYATVFDKYSTFADLQCRVPQASILGPMLFLLYITDMSQAKDCDLFLYTDDRCLLEWVKEEPLRYWVSVQQSQSYLIRRWSLLPWFSHTAIFQVPGFSGIG